MNLEEKTLSQSYPYRGSIINLRLDEALLPNGATARREVVEHPGGVCVAALTDREELLFVRQFRYPYGQVLLELPAGKLSAGEDPLECGKRELREETGAKAQQYLSLGKLYPSPGYCGKSSICIWPPACVSATASQMRTNSLRRTACRWRTPPKWYWTVALPTPKRKLPC